MIVLDERLDWARGVCSPRSPSATFLGLVLDLALELSSGQLKLIRTKTNVESSHNNTAPLQYHLIIRPRTIEYTAKQNKQTQDLSPHSRASLTLTSWGARGFLLALLSLYNHQALLSVITTPRTPKNAPKGTSR